MTRTAPCRLMILHFSHIGLTDGRTFMEPFGGESRGCAGAQEYARARPSKIAQRSVIPGPSTGTTCGVFEHFSDRSREAVVLAADEARNLGHDRIGTEHLLLGLVRLDDAATARLGLTLTATRQ